MLRESGVRSGYEVFNRSGLGPWLELWHPDVEYINSGKTPTTAFTGASM
jgi:hypothetical protein